MSSNSAPDPDPSRFEVQKATLFLDRAMTHLIRLGGLAVIVAVFGIFFFIVKEVIPLFGGSQVTEREVVETLVDEPMVLGVDEWGERPFLYQGGNEVVFLDAEDGSREVVTIPGFEEVEVTAVGYDPTRQRVAVGLKDGRAGSFLVRYEPKFGSDGKRTILAAVEAEPWLEVEVGEGAVEQIAYGHGPQNRLLVVGREKGVAFLRLGEKRGLIGKPKLTVTGTDDLSQRVTGKVVSVLASQVGDAALVATEDGKVHYFLVESGETKLKQSFEPFGSEPPKRMDYLFGGVSVAMTNLIGEQKVFSLFRPDGSKVRIFGETKDFPSIGAGVPVFAPSLRNKLFLTGAGGGLSLRHLTSGAIRWEGKVEFEPIAATIDGKAENFFIVGKEGQVQRFGMVDHHPEASWKAFFGKVWYEGGEGPVYQWQSTGGTDDFEPKLSLIPLIVGSLKGTLYALMFSLPIALLAAVFSASFLPYEMKKVVKPAMEIMASLPSVVLGFLAGLWLAPLLDERVPSVLLVCLSLPVAALVIGMIWCRQPIRVRALFEGGREWLVMVPVVFVVAWAAWSLGPVVEKFFFVYEDPTTGKKIADFRLWWPQVTGMSYDQKNSLVVGFMMGFAVIPVIFTIAEDALSNVPKTLTAAAAALGASRWQIVRTIIIPVASPGIFSALMIGFGRAVGETMIVVMATGNTPITDWNIFSGMRTLAANIAVELPEAAPGSTHYRTLFLGALVLFLMTFCLNTVAEVLRQRLREKNKIV